MKLFIGVVSNNPDLRRFIGRSKESLIPENFRSAPSGLVSEVAAVSWDPASGSSDDFAKFLCGHLADADGAMLLVGQASTGLIQSVASAFHVVVLPEGALGTSLQNFVQKFVAAGLNNFRRMSAMMRRGDDGRLLQLPLRNFVANELQEIARIAIEQGAERELVTNVEAQMVDLRRRVRPRKRSDFKQKYAVDDDQKFFQYGHERHGSFATGGHHTVACEIRGHFRFGHRVDDQRHYNVSKGEGDKTSISGDFLNCHDELETFGTTSHLNIFCNDNIK